MHAYIDILFRSIVSIFILLLIARILGKQTISNMTFHDFVTSITLGSVAANLAFNESLKWSYFIIALCVISLISFLLSVIAMKFRLWRSWISSSPTVLVEGGKILEGNMRKIRFTLDSLDQALRDKDIFNIDEVEYAVLEGNGKVSVLKKEEYKFVTKKDLQLSSSPQSFPVELIMDGRIIEKNLKEQGMSKEDLEEKLLRKGKRLADVFYAVKGTNQNLVFDFYEDDIHKPIDRE